MIPCVSSGYSKRATGENHVNGSGEMQSLLMVMGWGTCRTVGKEQVEKET